MRSTIATLARKARDGWLILGVTAAMGLTVELGARVALALAPVRPDPRAGAAATEGAPWAADLFRELHATEKMRWEPYLGWRRQPFSGRYIHVDERGLRRTVPDGQPGARRVFFFGGSTAWGTGARDEGTIPSLIARRTGWDVRNYGEAGYVSTQERFLLELELLRGEKPDLVVFYDGVNDVFATYQTHKGGLPQNEQFREVEFNISKSPRRLFTEGLRAALRDSGTLGLVRRCVGARPSPPPLPPVERDRLADEIAQAYAQNVADVTTLARAHGFEVAFFLQPVIYTKRHLAPDEQLRAAERAWVKDLYLAAYERIRARALPGVRDISDAFGDDPTPRYYDFCHVSEGANAVVAERILGALAAP